MKVHRIFLPYNYILGGLGKAIFLSFRIHCVELSGTSSFIVIKLYSLSLPFYVDLLGTMRLAGKAVLPIQPSKSPQPIAIGSHPNLSTPTSSGRVDSNGYSSQTVES